MPVLFALHSSLIFIVEQGCYDATLDPVKDADKSIVSVLRKVMVFFKKPLKVLQHENFFYRALQSASMSLQELVYMKPRVNWNGVFEDMTMAPLKKGSASKYEMLMLILINFEFQG